MTDMAKKRVPKEGGIGMVVGNGGGGSVQNNHCPIILHLLGSQPLCHSSKTVPVCLTFPSLPQLVG